MDYHVSGWRKLRKSKKFEITDIKPAQILVSIIFIECQIPVVFVIWQGKCIETETTAGKCLIVASRYQYGEK